MEMCDVLSGSPSTQVIQNSQLEDANAGQRLKSTERRVCRIAFEEYLNIWMKTATTNPEPLTGRESLDELIECTKRCHPVQAKHNTLAQKLPKKDTGAKRKRVERMRRLYMQCKTQELQIPGSAPGPDEQENWEQEMDELVEWIDSLSLKGLVNL